MGKELLLIFTKNPVAGKVKTRLAKDIGDEKALEIYKFLLLHSVKLTEKIRVDKQVYYSDEIQLEDIWDNTIFMKRQQEGNDLGRRMMNAFKAGFSEGYERIVIIGTDLFDITSKDIEDAFKNLIGNDYVIGPAADGGYYLLGMKSLNSKVFNNKEWGTSKVLQDTLKDLEGKSLKLLKTRNDVDVLDDIKEVPAFQKFIK